MGVAGQQNPPPQTLQRGMLHDAFHQPLTQPASTMRLENKNVAEIRDRGKVADHAGKADLCTATIINAKAQRMLDGSRHDLSRNSLRPIAIRQESVNDIQIEAGRVGADQVFATQVLDNCVGVGGGLHLYILNRGQPQSLAVST